MAAATVTDEILPVTRFSREGGDWLAHCPHCKRVVSMDGEEPLRGEIFQDKLCSGWMEVTHDAVRLKHLPEIPAE